MEAPPFSAVVHADPARSKKRSFWILNIISEFLMTVSPVVSLLFTFGGMKEEFGRLAAASSASMKLCLLSKLATVVSPAAP